MDEAPVDIVDRQPPQRLFNATDRCDQCGAQAHAASYHGASELLWCAHHYREHADKLKDEANLVIVDENSIKDLA